MLYGGRHHFECGSGCRQGRYTYGEAVAQAVALAPGQTLDCELAGGGQGDRALRPRQGLDDARATGDQAFCFVAKQRSRKAITWTCN